MSGAVALPNGFGVVIVGADENVVGGDAAGMRNVISGNKRDGLRIQNDVDANDAARDNKVQGNYVGYGRRRHDRDGQRRARDHAARATSRATSSATATSRSTASCWSAQAVRRRPCNRVLNNGVGVWVRSDKSTENTIRGNRLADNRFMGIDLATGNPTPNDVDDADDGANRLLNFPVAVSTYRDPETGQRRVSGRVVGPDPDKLKIDIYSSKDVDPTGHGEGRTWEASVTPDKSGSFTLDYTVFTDAFISATATDQAGNTSEFSPVCDDPDGDGRTDSDADGLCDDWEIDGIDFDGDGATDLPLGAGPSTPTRPRRTSSSRPTTWTRCFHDHEPEPGTFTDVTAAFAAAPVDAPKGIALHVTPGDADGADDDGARRPLLKHLARPGGRGRLRRPARRRPGAAMRRPLRHRRGPRQRRRHLLEDPRGEGDGVPLHDLRAHASRAPELQRRGRWRRRQPARQPRELERERLPARRRRRRDLRRPPRTASAAVEAGTFMHELGHTLGLGHGGSINAATTRTSSRTTSAS